MDSTGKNLFVCQVCCASFSSLSHCLIPNREAGGYYVIDETSGRNIIIPLARASAGPILFGSRFVKQSRLRRIAT